MNEKILPLLEAIAKTQEQLLQAIAELKQEATHPNIMSLADAAVVLGYGDNPNGRQQLRRLISGGLLRLGIEVEDRRLPNSQMPVYWLDIDKCRKRLKSHPEHRKVV